MNGMELIIAKPSAAMTQALEASSESAEKTAARAKLPLAIRVIHWICGAAAVIVTIGIIQALIGEERVSLPEAYHHATWLFWIAGGCFVLWLILLIISVKKAKSVFDCEESNHLLSNLNAICDGIYRELSVPADAQEVDILSFFYKTKDGDIKVCEKGFQAVPYFNPVFKIFADSENLYLANLEAKYSIPLSSLQVIRTVNKTIRVPGWNKEEAPNSGIYKQYKITTDNLDCIHSKPYHILEFHHNGDIWGIYFPCYELPILEAVTGIKAQSRN